MTLKKTVIYTACSLGLLAALAACGGSDAGDQTPSGLGLTKLSAFTHQGGEASAEITAYDAASKKLFVVNGALWSKVGCAGLLRSSTSRLARAPLTTNSFLLAAS